MDEQIRTEPSRVADERASLTEFLDHQRQTLAMKCAGLTPDQLRTRAVPPSALSLLGLVRHLADVERGWFLNVVAERDVPSYWGRTPDGSRADFEVAGADPERAFAVWEEVCGEARAVVAGVDSLDAVTYFDGQPYSLRYVLTHMIEEYARHNGHADLLRELIDGSTGE
ncbi:DinB family protein [Kitasatospora sp. CMC57]|uniref:DinB family protein n=1 Tax=Kitasatospora sp. CMC57 TaxID=3231513 RepID=A0AB33JYD2_9ACTN